ncbi:CRISPR-associated endonuclease Cas2 [bacterium]|nr:CRISPR-associated endonuclease Cas2 [bacterium]
MFIILVYDVAENRCGKMLKLCRKYIQWVQNSVFEGDITEGNYNKLVYEINRVIDKTAGDSVIIYQFQSLKYSKRLVYGLDKKDDLMFI